MARSTTSNDAVTISERFPDSISSPAAGGFALFIARVLTALTVGGVACALAGCGGGSGSSRILQSGGSLNWQRISVPSGAVEVSGFAVNSGNHWFIADRNQGFYRSTDQGGSWTSINSGGFERYA